jgi:hypothetical protein
MSVSWLPPWGVRICPYARGHAELRMWRPGHEPASLLHPVGMATNSVLDFLTAWFAQQCDGDWEHDLGIRIETLDNPGWALDIRIGDTELEGVSAEWHKNEASEDTWLYWRSTGDMFEARCGPKDLARALAAFQMFASSAET